LGGTNCSGLGRHGLHMKTDAETESRGGKNAPVIMAVEDDPTSLHTIKTVLEKRGYVVESAKNAEEALRQLRLRAPAVLILDVMMPGMSGYDLCQTIKRDQVLRKIPVIFLTAKDTAEDFKCGREAGGVFYILKPIRPDRLAQAVGMLCRPPQV